MTFENIYYISQTIAVFAIIISLIFVGIQVQQSKEKTEQANKLAQAQLTQTTWIASGNFHTEGYSTPEKAKFMARALLTDLPLEDYEKLSLNAHLTTVFSNIEMSAVLKEQGLFNDGMYERNKMTIASYFEHPRVHKWWENVGRHYFTSEFLEVIEDIAKTVKPSHRNIQIDKDKPEE